MLVTIPFLRAASAFAVDRLADVDYTVANRVAEDVARVVHFAYDHDVPRLAMASVDLLRRFDEFGGVLIAFVAWLVAHTP